MCTLIMIFIGIFIWIVSPKWLGEVGKYPVSKDKKNSTESVSTKSTEKAKAQPLTQLEKIVLKQ